MYWNEYKTKSENKNTTNEYRDFIESKSVGFNILIPLIYSNQYGSVKRFTDKKYYLPNVIIKNYNLIVNGKKFHGQPFESYIKRCEEIRKLDTVQGEDYTTGYHPKAVQEKSRCSSKSSSGNRIFWAIKKY